MNKIKQIISLILQYVNIILWQFWSAPYRDHIYSVIILEDQAECQPNKILIAFILIFKKKSNLALMPREK